MTILKTTLVLATIIGPIAGPLFAQTESENRANLAMAIAMQGHDCARIDGNTSTTDTANIYTVMCKTNGNTDAWFQINIENFEITPLQQAQ